MSKTGGDCENQETKDIYRFFRDLGVARRIRTGAAQDLCVQAASVHVGRSDRRGIIWCAAMCQRGEQIMNEKGDPKGVSTLTLNVNDKEHVVSVAPDTPLLWVIRENLGLTGTKFGCGVSICGACTIHVDGDAVRSCTTAVSEVVGKKIVTIEGLSADGRHPVQKAWIEEEVPQCGYCHSGQIMAAAALLAENPNPTDEDIDDAMSDNLCRCGTYQRIRQAIHRAAKLAAE